MRFPNFILLISTYSQIKNKKSQCIFEEDPYQETSYPNRKSSAKIHVVCKDCLWLFKLLIPQKLGNPDYRQDVLLLLLCCAEALEEPRKGYLPEGCMDSARDNRRYYRSILFLLHSRAAVFLLLYEKVSGEGEVSLMLCLSMFYLVFPATTGTHHNGSGGD